MYAIIRISNSDDDVSPRGDSTPLTTVRQGFVPTTDRCLYGYGRADGFRNPSSQPRGPIPTRVYFVVYSLYYPTTKPLILSPFYEAVRMKISSALVLMSLGLSDAWVPSVPRGTTSSRLPNTELRMALNYNDPAVAEEFAKVQPMSYEDVEDELRESGVRPGPTMNDMEVKLMLVEVRLRNSGKIGGNDRKAQRPAKFSSKFEEALWTKPVFQEFYEVLKKRDDYNSMNVVAEYLNNPDQAKQRYQSSYGQLLRQVDRALNAPPPVLSPTIQFSGFPANMGEAACKMTLESIGTITEFECVVDDDFPILKGRVTFEDIDAAKKAVQQYNGMNMGMGTSLELVSV